jgi:hypothetical protein
MDYIIYGGTKVISIRDIVDNISRCSSYKIQSIIHMLKIQSIIVRFEMDNSYFEGRYF